MTGQTGSCEVCFRDTRPGVELCDECADWEDYWFGLTPEQQEQERQRMDRYVMEQEARCQSVRGIK